VYKLIFKNRAKKNLKKIYPKDKDRILLTLEEFCLSPFSKNFNIAKLKGFPNLERAYRLRVGNLRVIYELYQKEKLIIVYLIDYRRTTTYSFS
jgi:mRNA-degrading endonuclease RelE of RelBE toxin-antitoxin system